jgi:site-specific DNA recombinase
VDCLNHVRKLKFDYNVEVFFEKENIYSFDSKMELVLTMLSSIAQEESRNISENTKWGIKKRFKDGVAICNTSRFLGYDKDEKRNLIINIEEAKIVKRIFREYLDGKGFTSIANGLEKDNIPTVTGATRWWDSTISGVLSNEKYCGDLLLQKTVTVDYLTKKRVDNNNIAPQYMVENNHEPIISKEMFEMVKKERERRFQITSGKDKDRRKYLTRYGFSGKLICDKCGITLKRRHWNTGTPSEKIVWQCNNYIRGIKYCNAKAVNDTDLKEAFIRLYNNLVKDKGSFFTAFLKNAEKVLDKAEKNDRLSSITDSIRQTEEDMSELVQLKIRKQVDDKTYQKEYMRISDELETLNAQKDSLVKNTLDESKAMDKVAYIKKVVNDSKEPLSEFDDELFKALIDKVIIKSPKKFVFIFESGYEVEMDIG